MPDPEFALIDKDTLRAMIFWIDGSSAIRLRTGEWLYEPRTVEEIIMPEESREFKTATSTELAELSKQALMGLGKNK